MYILSEIVDFFTFVIRQSAMFTDRVGPPVETLTLFYAWLGK